MPARYCSTRLTSPATAPGVASFATRPRVHRAGQPLQSPSLGEIIVASGGAPCVDRSRGAGRYFSAMAAQQRPPRKLCLRYPASCVACGIALSKGTEALWDPGTKTATCVACLAGDATIDAGDAGSSAAAEGERRAARKIEEVRRKYGDHAANVAREMAGRDASASWGKGSEGESWLASYIAREVGDSVIALHDRLVPGTRGNIDHIFVASTGVWVVDAKAYKGKLVQREAGPLWRRENEVFVGGRNRSSLASGVVRQVDAVIAAMRPDESFRGTEVHAALCFTEAGWGLLDFPFQVGNVWVMYPGALKKRLRKRGPLSQESMERFARRLDLSLPPAAS